MPTTSGSRKHMLDDTQFFEMIFGGKQITSRPGFLIGQGNYTEMQNMRYKREGIGVETRDGCRRFNTTPVTGGADVDKIYQHLYQRAQTDYQDVYIVSNESPRNIYKLDSIPEATAGAGSIGSALVALTAGAKIPTFCSVEDIAIACSDKDLLATAGTSPYCAAFYVGDDIDNATTGAAEDDKTYRIYTDEVTDEDTTTMATFTLDTLATDNVNAVYVGYWQPISGVTFDLGTSVNNNVATLTVRYWNGSAWVDTVNDGGTDSPAGTPFAIDGTIAWTMPAVGTEKPRRINGLTLYWYRITTDALLDEVDILKVTVTKGWRAIEDLTDGEDLLPTGCLWYDATDQNYIDFAAEVASDSTGTFARFTDAAGDRDFSSNDYLYVGFPIRVIGMIITVDSSYNNDGGNTTMTVAYWDGTQWVSYAADEYFDGTTKDSKSFNQTGEIRIEDKGTTVRMTTVGGKKLPMFWYRISQSNDMYNDANDEMHVWKIRGIPAPKTIKKYTCCLNFKDRLFLFGREDAPNTGDYSSYKNPFALSGFDTSSVQPRVTFGNMDRITASVNFYNEALIFKRTEVWMMQGDSPETFGTLLLDNTVGCVAPETVKQVRMWIQNPDGLWQYQHVILFQALDGLYGCDGIKCFKVSEDIDNYFDPSKTECIKDGYLAVSRSWYDNLRSEYHFIFWSGATPTIKEFVLNTELRRWSGPWSRAVDILCGATLLGASTQYLQYGGGTDGIVYHLECNSYTDVNAANAATAINSFVTVADLWKELGSKWGFRGVHLYGEAQTAGDVTVVMLGDGKSTGTTLGTISMINSGFANFQGRVQIGDKDSGGTAMENKFQSARFRFQTNTAAVKQLLYGYRIKRDFVGEAAV